MGPRRAATVSAGGGGRSRIALLVRLLSLALLLISCLTETAESQVRRGKRFRESDDPGDGADTIREHGVGSIPLGASAKGHIVLGFYNMISFEAVEGTRVQFELLTRHQKAKLIADLLPPGRKEKIPFAADKKIPRRLVLQDYVLKQTGVYTVRFGFAGEHNGNYTLNTDAEVPTESSTTISFTRKDLATLHLPGMAARKIKSLAIDMPDGMVLETEISDPHGFPVDLEEHLKMQNWDRRIVISDLIIESSGQYELRLTRIEGDDGPVQVTVEYTNPKLVKKTYKI